jgi:hypothetical protein
VDFIHALERACFDDLIIEDSAYAPDGYDTQTSGGATGPGGEGNSVTA